MIGILTNTGKFSIFKIGDLQIKFALVHYLWLGRPSPIFVLD